MIIQLYDKKTFLFFYNKIKNPNLYLDFNFKKFCFKKNVIIAFITYFIKFKKVIKLKQMFNYNFRLYNIYFINNKKKVFLLLIKKNIDLING